MVFLDEGSKIWSTEKDGYVFLHIEITTWTPSEYKKIKNSVYDVTKYYRDRGHELVFATTDDEKITKMWGRLKPLYELNRIKGNGHWIGAWETEG